MRRRVEGNSEVWFSGMEGVRGRVEGSSEVWLSEMKGVRGRIEVGSEVWSSGVRMRVEVWPSEREGVSNVDGNIWPSGMLGVRAVVETFCDCWSVETQEVRVDSVPWCYLLASPFFVYVRT